MVETADNLSATAMYETVMCVALDRLAARQTVIVPARFAWLQAHRRHPASEFNVANSFEEQRLYIVRIVSNIGAESGHRRGALLHSIAHNIVCGIHIQPERVVVSDTNRNKRDKRGNVDREKNNAHDAGGVKSRRRALRFCGTARRHEYRNWRR